MKRAEKNFVRKKKAITARAVWAGLFALLIACTGIMPPHVAGLAKELDCHHVHDDACGYREAIAAAPCNDHHRHNKSCGYREAIMGVNCTLSYEAQVDAGIIPEISLEGIPLWCHDMDEDGMIDHLMGCEYVEAVPAQPCLYVHTHDANCGYREAVGAIACGHAHVEDCYVANELEHEHEDDGEALPESEKDESTQASEPPDELIAEETPPVVGNTPDTEIAPEDEPTPEALNTPAPENTPEAENNHEDGSVPEEANTPEVENTNGPESTPKVGDTSEAEDHSEVGSTDETENTQGAENTPEVEGTPETENTPIPGEPHEEIPEEQPDDTQEESDEPECICGAEHTEGCEALIGGECLCGMVHVEGCPLYEETPEEQPDDTQEESDEPECICGAEHAEGCEALIGGECLCGMTHVEGCPLYIEEEIHVTPEAPECNCGVEHPWDCETWYGGECTCGVAHGSNCPLNNEDIELECICGAVHAEGCEALHGGECACGMTHVADCPLYEEAIILECNCGAVHAEGCEALLGGECACGMTHASDCPLYEEPTELECTCGVEHAEDCEALNGGECTCGLTHDEGCPLYIESECTCGAEHAEDCEFLLSGGLCTCGMRHAEDCALYNPLDFIIEEFLLDEILYFEVPRGTPKAELPLPQLLKATAASGKEIMVPVTWANGEEFVNEMDIYMADPSTIYEAGMHQGYGPWDFTMQLDPPLYVYEGEALTAQVAYPDCFEIASFCGMGKGNILMRFVAKEGEGVLVPSSTGAIMSDGGYKNVPVTWSGSYDVNRVGEYTLSMSMSIGSGYYGGPSAFAKVLIWDGQYPSY